MQTLTLMPFLLAMFVAVAAMPTNVFQICAWNAGTEKVDPWRIRTAAAVRNVAQTLRAWLASIWSPRIAFACLALLLAVMLAQHGAGHDGVLLAITPAGLAAIQPLQTQRAQLLRDAEGLRAQDGTFKDDATRATFDAKMAEIEAIDVKIRAHEAEPAATPAATPDAVAIVRAAEQARITGIHSAVRTAKLDEAFAADLVKRNVSIDQARSEIFAEMAKRSDTIRTDSHITLGEDARDKWMRGATNWLLVKSGMAELVARATKVTPDTIDPGEFRGFTLLDLARQALERAGKATRGLDKMRIISEAFLLRDSGGAQGTSDFTVALENVMHKVLLAAYVTQPDTWRRFCAQGTVSDFRAHNRYRIGGFGVLDAVNEHGEFKNKAISDAEKASITAGTKGNIIAITRQAIMNDDMGTFTGLLARLGRAAGLSVEVDVYALLALNAGLGPDQSDGQPLFHANRSNVGTGAAISAAALDADRVVMAKQTGPGGTEYLDLRPAVLLVPVELGGTARSINAAQYDPDTANKLQKPNIVQGLFRDIVDSPRVTTPRRYLFADKDVAPVIEVAFLEGQTAPVLETKDGWRTDGTEMKVRFDYGVAGVDYRGAVTNAGQ